MIYASLIVNRNKRDLPDFYFYNPILIGLTVGYFFGLSPLSVVLVFVASLLTFHATQLLHGFLAPYGLPVLSLPFSLVGLVVLAAASDFALKFELASPLWSQLNWWWGHVGFWGGFFKSLGTILLSPYPLVGLVLFAMLLIQSRLLALLALAGYSLGFLYNWLWYPNPLVATASFRSFNDCLTFMALGGFFLAPQLRTFVFAAIAVFVVSVFAAGLNLVFAPYHIPVMALPFNLTTLLVLYTYKSFAARGVMVALEDTPEKTLSRYLLDLPDGDSLEPILGLPFKGDWQIYQGFEGPWTHQGKWQYALDFVKSDSRGKSYDNDGCKLEDYFAFHQDVLAPVAGYIVGIEDQLPDNLIGIVDQAHNWGNYVMIRCWDGTIVKLGHLAFQSILVRHGAFVSQGQPLAKCGNSGYSPEPHIHMQAQRAAIVGDETISFRLSSYIKGDQLQLNHLPNVSDQITALSGNKGLQNLLSLTLDQVLTFELDIESQDQKQVSFKVEMNRMTGQFYLSDDQGSQLFFAVKNSLFQFTSLVSSRPTFLEILYAAAPIIPLNYGQVLKWQSSLPMHMEYSGLKYELMNLVATIAPQRIRRNCSYSCDSSGTKIKGRVPYRNRLLESYCSIDPQYGFDIFRIGAIELKRSGKKGHQDDLFSQIA